MARTKTNTQNNTKTRRIPWHNSFFTKSICIVFFGLFLIIYIFKWFLQEMLSYRLGTVNN